MTSSIKKTKEGGVLKLRASWSMTQRSVTLTLTRVTQHVHPMTSHKLVDVMPVMYVHEMRRQGECINIGHV